METGRTIPSAEDAASLTQTYQASPEVQARVTEVNAQTRRAYLHSTPESQRRLAALEKSSAHMRTYSPAVIPGLLQTPDYMRAILTAHGPQPRNPEQVDEAVRLRVQHQDLLVETSGELTLITTEGALGWMASSPEVMTTQLDHITQLGQPRLRVGIIPWGTRAAAFPLHTWDLYDSRAVSFATVTGTALLTDQRDVSRYLDIFTQLETMATFGDQAHAILDQAIKKYREL
jgi:hypothetical protein